MPILRNFIRHTALTFIAGSAIALYSGLLEAAPGHSNTVNREDKVKAAIVFKLTRFITWPKPRQTLALCVIGSGPINQELLKINHKYSLGRRISVTHKAPGAPLEKLCDLVFIHNTDVKTTLDVTRRLKSKPVLTISDNDNFANQGGMIGLYRTGSRIRFAISQSATQGTGLTIDSQLMGMAKRTK